MHNRPTCVVHTLLYFYIGPWEILFYFDFEHGVN